MSEVVIVALITSAFSLIGTFGGILTSSKLSNYRIAELEKKVDKHNNMVEKYYGLEKDITDIQKDVDDMNRDQKDLKAKTNDLDKRVTILENERR